MSFEVREHQSRSYGPRTYLNAGYSDLTVAFAANFNTAGEILTERASKGRIIQFELSKEFDTIKAARQLYQRMKHDNCKTLNIAGNGAYTLHTYGIYQDELNKWVYEVLEPIHKHIEITRIRTGGQTGADMAGSVAAYVLEIPSLITYPNGYRQRLEDGSEVIQSQEAALDTIVRYADRLKENLTNESINKLQQS